MDENTHVISSDKITLTDIHTILRHKKKLVLGRDALEKITTCRNYLDRKIRETKTPLYGINTGFGALFDKIIPDDQLEILQSNLVKSHACGTGGEVPADIVRIMLLLKIQALSYGMSGVQTKTVQRLVDLFNHDVLPVVYRYGSLGASGDLAPLAHLSLPLIGLGEVMVEGKKITGAEICRKLGWEPLHLKSKEGLALLNGTQFMSAYGVHLLHTVFRLSDQADIIASLSLDAFDGNISPFHPLIQQIRPYKGQKQTASRVREILQGSDLIDRPGKAIQDPYSFRCIPQVHGASKDAIHYVAYVFENEINSVTDNPTIFPDEDLIISAGNFHGQPLSLALDNLTIAMAELGNISERRVYQLLSGKRGLPSFLVSEPGLNSGFMIPQYTAAAMVSLNKQLSTPASVDSIETSQGQEDHVSMGATAAIKAYEVVTNIEKILAIELMNAAQALEFRRPRKTSPYLEKFVSAYRRQVPFLTEDQPLYPYIDRSVEFLRSFDR
ncbi:MAG: histidine ammonia-lyase [Chlorobi bacterium]|nr:histidine ammonia-lyase [Chlorobiota bacterium]